MYSQLSGLPLAQIAIIGFIVSFFLKKREHYNKNIQNVLILAYLFWFFISYLFSFEHDLAWQAWVDFSKWVIIYFLLINTINDRSKMYIFLFVLLFLNFKYAQFASRLWIASGFYSDPRGLNAGGGIGAGFFQNPNDFGVAINSVLGLSYCMMQSDLTRVAGFRMRWFHLICVVSMIIGILASSSRGAAVGLGAISLAIWYKSERKMISVALLIVFASILIGLIPEDNWARFQKMGTEEDASGQSRLALWEAGMRMASEYPITGVGPNNFIYVNTQKYLSEHHEVQHNVFVQAVSELGYPGLILFVSMILCCFYNQRKSRKILLQKRIDEPFLVGLSHGLDLSMVGFVVNGFFITVLYYPFFWMLLILSVALIDIVERLEPKGKLQSMPGIHPI